MKCLYELCFRILHLKCLILIKLITILFAIICANSFRIFSSLIVEITLLGHLKEELSKTAKDAADTLSESGSKIGKTSAFRTISETAQAVQKEIDTSSFGGRVYRAPTQLRRRVEVSLNKTKVTPNEEATGMELHKDSR